MSYAQVDAAATRIAQMLRNRGVKPGDRVAMLMANFPITVALLFGIWRAEATAVPLNTLYRPDELGFVLRQSAPRLLIAMTRFLKRDFASEIPRYCRVEPISCSMIPPRLPSAISSPRSTRCRPSQPATWPMPSGFRQ